MKVRLVHYLIFALIFTLFLGFNSVYADLSSGNIILIASYTDWPSTWTSIIPIKLNNDRITDLLFYSQSEDTVQFYTVTKNGSVNLVREYSLGSLAPYNHIFVPINLNNDGITDLLHYIPSLGRAEFITVKSNGDANIIASYDDWSRTWTSIIPINLNFDGITDLLFYSPSEKTGEFDTVNSHGQLTNVKTYTDWSSTWTSIIPIYLNNDRITDLFFYSPSESRGEFDRVNSHGELTLVTTHEGMDSTYSSIVPTDLSNDDGITDLLLYSPSQNTGEFIKVTSTGDFISIKKHTDWPSTWTSITPINLNNDRLTDFLFYSPSEKTGEFDRLSHFNPNRDRDGDGIKNLWEIEGIDSNSDGVLDFRLPDADVAHKDLYVEVDSMEHHIPNTISIQNVKNSFTDSPNSNPDGQFGINLHVQLDEENIPHQDHIDLDDLVNIEGTHFGTLVERSNPNSENIINAKASAYHYALFAHDQSGDDAGSSGHSNGIPSREFMVTLGGPRWGTDSTGHHVGSMEQQAGTFMHEFGHNLGLKHGGDEDQNCKPNYMSVMSYSRQMPSLIPSRPLDYSRSKIATLNEGFLDENHGIGVSVPPDLDTAIGPYPPDIVTTGNPVDWNKDGDTQDTNVNRDIDWTRQTGDCRESPADPEFGQVHTGYNDWAHLNYNYQPPCQFCGLEKTKVRDDHIVEFTSDELIEDRIILFDHIENTLKSLPSDAYKNQEVASVFKGDFNLLYGNQTIGFKNLLKTENIDQMIAILEQLKSWTDSSIGGNESDDLITSAEAQQKVLPLIQDLILALEKQK